MGEPCWRSSQSLWQKEETQAWELRALRVPNLVDSGLSSSVAVSGGPAAPLLRRRTAATDGFTVGCSEPGASGVIPYRDLAELCMLWRSRSMPWSRSHGA